MCSLAVRPEEEGSHYYSFPWVSEEELLFLVLDSIPESLSRNTPPHTHTPIEHVVIRIYI